MEEPCTVLEELHKTKTKALKAVNFCYYCLQAKYSTYCLFFAQFILSIVYYIGITITVLQKEKLKSQLKISP